MKTATALVAVSALVCLYGVLQVQSVTLCNTWSTVKIITKLCYMGNNKVNQTLIDPFFACYDQAPGKAQFVKCQTDLFGGPMNTVQTVSASCSSPLKIPTYANCIKTELAKVGIDMDEAVGKVNACQSKALGITTRALCN